MYSKANGLRIIGYYEANECVDDEALSLVGQKISEQILKAEPEAFALVVSFFSGPVAVEIWYASRRVALVLMAISNAPRA